MRSIFPALPRTVLRRAGGAARSRRPKRLCRDTPIGSARANEVACDLRRPVRRLARWLRRHPHDVYGFMPPAIAASPWRAGLGDDRPRLIAPTHNVPTIDFGEGGRWDQTLSRVDQSACPRGVDAVTVLLHTSSSSFRREPGLAAVMPNGVRRLGDPANTQRRNTVLGVGRPRRLSGTMLIEAFGRPAASFLTGTS